MTKTEISYLKKENKVHYFIRNSKTLSNLVILNLLSMLRRFEGPQATGFGAFRRVVMAVWWVFAFPWVPDKCWILERSTHDFVYSFSVLWYSKHYGLEYCCYRKALLLGLSHSFDILSMVPIITRGYFWSLRFIVAEASSCRAETLS